MKIIILNIFLIITLYGSILDDWNIYQAQQLSNKKKYQKALLYYQKIEHKNDAIYYNMANLYYYLKQYQNAIVYYNKINKSILAHKKFHNLANCYIKLQEYDKAIEFNTRALISKHDPKTKYNLELAKVRYTNILHKIQQIKKKGIRAGTSVETDEANTFDDNFEIEEAKLGENKPLKEIKSFLGISNLENNNDYENDISVKDTKIDDNKIIVNIKLSEYIQQKWDKKMKTNIKLYTLVIPLFKGDANDSQIPW